MEQFDALIIGAGAAGLMCAVQAGYLGKRVLLLEKNEKAGAKILISGGGRCNYMNLNTGPDNFISGNEHFVKSALSQFSVEDTLQFFEMEGIQGIEKTLGQLFPESNKARDIVNIFLRRCEDFGQKIITEANVLDVDLEQDGTFRVKYELQGKTHHIGAARVVMASGGLPVQKMGASDFALKMARKFGLQVSQTAPALVPLTITGKDAEWYAALSGNSVYCRVSNDRISFDENILFTHWGLSGPAILQISSYWRPGEKIRIDLLPDRSVEDLIAAGKASKGRRSLGGFLAEFYTRKLADAFAGILPLEKTLSDLSKDDIIHIVKWIHHFEVKPAGDKGYDRAEVMRGGVDTSELSSKTLEAKKVPGLFFCGECVDVTGWLGGYNFQWAWSSGYVVAQNL